MWFCRIQQYELRRWAFSFKRCFILVYDLQKCFQQLYRYWASKGDKYAYDPHCHRNWWTGDKGPSKLKFQFKIIENTLFLLPMIYVNENSNMFLWWVFAEKYVFWHACDFPLFLKKITRTPKFISSIEWRQFQYLLKAHENRFPVTQ